jgi:Flp pilus assembly protein TadG
MPHPFSEQTMDSCGSTNRPRSAAHRLASEESGQIMMLTGLLLVIMLAAVALVIDIGHAQLVQRQLQAGVDAAALAGAQDLPIKADAEATANEFSPTPGSKNAVNTVDNATTTVDVRCITTIPGCNTRYGTSNAVSVSASAKVPTFFGRIVGVDSLTVRARATACYPCAVRPLDIMLVLDRTGSMCNGGTGPCEHGADIDAAKDGVSTFISLMDPKLDRVGLAVLPPVTGPSLYHFEDVAPCLHWKKFPHNNANCDQWTQKQVRNPDSPSDVCATPTSSNLNYGYDAYTPWWKAETDGSYKNTDRAWYVVSSLSDDDVAGDPAGDDYVVKDAQGQWDLNPSAPINTALACLDASGGTSYSMAIDEAEHELQTHGRPDVQDVIVFFTDGGANSTPGSYATNYWAKSPEWFKKPCGSGVQAAKVAKAADPDGSGPLTGAIVYTIGYDISDNPPANQRCGVPDSNGHQDNGNGAEPCQTWGCSPKAALQSMASLPQYFSQPKKPADLQPLFFSVAGQVLLNAARLVDNDLPDLTE